VDDQLILTITDNGRGIDLKRYGGQLFGLYKRFHFDIEGKGLGLHMTKSQIVSLGGDITVESEPDKGTTFTITLPNNSLL
jgi:signal transduction histidine kinase